MGEEQKVKDIGSSVIVGGFQIEPDNWKHRSKGMKCRTCMWFVLKDAGVRLFPEGMAVGRCRRHSPTMGGWVIVRDGDWCGDHRLDENKA